MTEAGPAAPPVPVDKILWPFREFARLEASGGILLFACAVVALVWANSPWATSYETLWQIPVTVGAGAFVLSKPLLLWINDGLMAVFFFVVGLEIKREVLAGELASPRKAALPIAAALGGMVVPAAIYTVFTVGTPGVSGWGIPMATDIAFALGVLALLGDRVSTSLKIFLTALAIVDDLGAVLVIALFYTAEISWGSLALGLVGLVALLGANRAGVRGTVVYGLVGAVIWVAFLKSGVHATIAGVLLAMTIPARTRIDTPVFVARCEALLDNIPREVDSEEESDAARQAAVEELEAICEQAQTPVQRLDHMLHPWVAFAIMPVFALANAGVSIGEGAMAALVDPITLGVILGLVVGKQVGVMLFSWMSVRLGLAALPSGVTWRQLYGTSWLAGIGFTMSLFIAGLAFHDVASLAAAKIGILAASVVAGIVGWILLRRATGPAKT